MSDIVLVSCGTKEKEQRLIDPESGWVRVGRHVYSRTVVSVSYHYKNPTKCAGLVQSGPHHHFIDKDNTLRRMLGKN
jgi:hypothetical protein